jgi:hypothetical protein
VTKDQVEHRTGAVDQQMKVILPRAIEHRAHHQLRTRSAFAHGPLRIEDRAQAFDLTARVDQRFLGGYPQIFSQCIQDPREPRGIRD